MTNKIKQIIKTKQNLHLLFNQRIGLEIEILRITPNGKLSTTPHPINAKSKNITTDFAQAQAEIVTNVHQSPSSMLAELKQLFKLLHLALPNNESLWPLSLPPKLTSTDLINARDLGVGKSEASYHYYLAQKYPISHKIMSGIHFNFSFDEDILHLIYQDYLGHFKNLRDFKNSLYLHLTQNLVLIRPLITYLFGASPFAETGFELAHNLELPVRSLRNSNLGYCNLAKDQINADIYQSLDYFVQKLNEKIKTKTLYAASEFYGPIRFRGVENIHDLNKNGVDYLEFRGLDLNPFKPHAISQTDLEFLQLLTIFCATEPISVNNLSKQLKEAHEKNNLVALEHPSTKTQLYPEFKEIFVKLRDLVEKHKFNKRFVDLINKYESLIDNPKLTPAGQIVENIRNKNGMDFGIKWARNHKIDQIFVNHVI